ncbi:rod shape-determining protein MreC [Campylobacter sp. RM16187]|uniref:rod shape-determining protein MreC n=1 Tax=Campylobacter sp. RM16187 TaxID=1660063 RepID=UPI0021B65E41|nr:rod shape-determining protein MreC [Campylobacter sp. RM16187]QKG28544.1 rod shape-determining protein MreC [Campylobacter sp. RM16187]
MKSKILFVILIGALVLGSLYKGEIFSKEVVNLNSSIVKMYDDGIKIIVNKVNEHFRQKEEIISLRTQNAELEKSAVLLASFAKELNEILIDKNSSIYEPKIQLVRALSYVNISDYNKIWLDKFDDFNSSKIYGLIYQGKSAGIVISKDDRPMAILQNDPKNIFAVFVGNEKIPGIAHGNKNGLLIKFIPQWLHPKEDDEVYTSGLDGIFFSGVPVGKVTKVIEESLYKSVLVEPYVKVDIPSYLYVVTKEK